MKTQIRSSVKTEFFEEVLTEVEKEKALILFNDDVNTFDFVIDCLMEICEHEFEQAEQCAHIVHYKGKCDVKHGNQDDLELRQKELLRRGLTVEIH
jgi:ATP-dependent Clp protease adaptor protein ClpS